MVEIDHGFTTDMKYAVAGTFTGGLSSKIYPLLKSEWYNVNKVYPVCSGKKEIDGDPAYASLKDLPEPVDVVVVVHKKELSTEIVREAATLDPKPAIWFMPRTDSKESIAICEDNNMKYGMSCLMGHRDIPGLKRFVNGHWWHSKVGGMNRIPKQ
ncbi:MAG: CoA-binding protein [Candidatus Heimdallarchaeota archaeon]|nr:MAG: CoA-binding protein [Candidatus Heimdallarchaeota archaeon]